MKTIHCEGKQLAGLCRKIGSLALLLAPMLVQGQIESAKRLTLHPNQYGRVDYVIMLTADWTNSPYRAEEIRLDLELSAPSGSRLTVPAYYERGRSGALSTWRLRFTPIEAGDYSGTFVLLNGTNRSGIAVKFPVAASNGKGFLHPGNAWTFRFDNGEPFRGIGENIGWESRSRDDSQFFRELQESPRYNYEYLLGTLAEHGGNFFRTWMCPWNLPLEWKKVGNESRYADDENYFNASAIRRMDQLVDLAEALDLRIMLTLNNSGDFQGRSWERNNYNIKNGGFAAMPQEFFTNPQAKAQYKDRLRYLVARWGYSPHIAAWEFFNEIDNLMYGLPQRIPDDVITAWHTEMSAYLKSIDPYHHLVTTSISHRPVAGLNQVPAIDFNQIHIYGHNGASRISAFADVLRNGMPQTGKPTVIGECGFEWDWSKNFNDYAAGMERDFKEALWQGLFLPTPILPMSWWWEYFDSRGMTAYLERVRPVLDQMLAAGVGDFVPCEAKWEGDAVRVIAVRCGQTFFVLITNDDNTPAHGKITLPLEVAQKYQVHAYDGERGTTEALMELAAGETTVRSLVIPASTHMVLTIAP